MDLTALICREIIQNPQISQSDLNKQLNRPLSQVNAILEIAMQRGLVKESGGHYHITANGMVYMEQFRVDNAIILAAGFGVRLAPFTYKLPKGLLEIKGTPLIERQIEQLLDRGIHEIIIVVGYLKEKFEYLIEKYGVKLIYNPEYATKNNFVSVFYALDYLKATYLLMADHWLEDNIFNTYELESWYSCLYFEGHTDEWGAKANPLGRITEITISGRDTWAIVGPSYFNAKFSSIFARLTREYYAKPNTKDYFWEHILMENLHILPMYMNRQTRGNVREFDTLADFHKYDLTT